MEADLEPEAERMMGAVVEVPDNMHIKFGPCTTGRVLQGDSPMDLSLPLVSWGRLQKTHRANPTEQNK